MKKISISYLFVVLTLSIGTASLHAEDGNEMAEARKRTIKAAIQEKEATLKYRQEQLKNLQKTKAPSSKVEEVKGLIATKKLEIEKEKNKLKDYLTFIKEKNKQKVTRAPVKGGFRS